MSKDEGNIKPVGTIIGKCKDQQTKRKRGKEANVLWNALISNGVYQGGYDTFNDAYVLFREALNCYSTCAYMATAILCRTTLEAAVYRLTQRICYKTYSHIINSKEASTAYEENPGDLLADCVERCDCIERCKDFSPILLKTKQTKKPETEQKEKKVSYEDAIKVLESCLPGVLNSSIRIRNFNINKELTLKQILDTVRDEGNYAAHYSERVDREFIKLAKMHLKRRTPNGDLPSGNETSTDKPVVLWITQERAFEVLTYTIEALTELGKALLEIKRRMQSWSRIAF